MQTIMCDRPIDVPIVRDHTAPIDHRLWPYTMAHSSCHIAQKWGGVF